MAYDAVIEPYLDEVGRARRLASPDDLITSHLLLALKIAGEFRGENHGVDYADLVGQANLGLVRAARDYPKSKAKAEGISFASYAAKAIKNALLEEIRRGQPVHIQSKAWQEVKRYQETASRLSSDQEVADELGVPVERVWLLKQYAQTLEQPRRWDEIVSQDGHKPDTLADITPDPSQDVEHEVLTKIERESLRQKLIEAVDELPPQPKLAVSLRFGLETPSLAVIPLDKVLHVSQRMAERSHGLDAGLQRLRDKEQEFERPASLSIPLRHITKEQKKEAAARLRAQGWSLRKIGREIGVHSSTVSQWLQEAVEGEKDGRAMVSKDRTPIITSTDSPYRPGTQARIERDKLSWRRVASEPPPAALDAANERP